MKLCINDEKLSEKHKTICTKIENLSNNELNALQVYDDRYIKTKIKTYGDKVYTNFPGLNAPEDHLISEYLAVISSFYSPWFFTCIRKQISNASTFRKLCL